MSLRQVSSRTHVHVHVKLPSRQDARPPVPWRHTVEGADQSNTKFGFSPHKSITPPLSPTPLFSRSLPEPFSRPQFSSPPPRRLSPRRRRSSVVSCPARAGLQGTARPDATGGRTAGTGSSCSSSNTPASSGHQWYLVLIRTPQWPSMHLRVAADAGGLGLQRERAHVVCAELLDCLTEGSLGVCVATLAARY